MLDIIPHRPRLIKKSEKYLAPVDMVTKEIMYPMMAIHHQTVSPLCHLTHYVTSIPATGAHTGIHTHNNIIALLETYIYETNYDN